MYVFPLPYETKLLVGRKHILFSFSLCVPWCIAHCLAAVGIQQILLECAQQVHTEATHMGRCVRTLRGTRTPIHFSVLVLADHLVCM